MPRFFIKKIPSLMLILLGVFWGCLSGFGIDSPKKEVSLDERILGKWKINQLLAGKPVIQHREFHKNGEVWIQNAFRSPANIVKKFYVLEEAKLYILSEEEWKKGSRPSDYELIQKLDDRYLWVERLYERRGRWIKQPMARYEKIEQKKQ